MHRSLQESTATAREGIGYFVENDSNTAVLVPESERCFKIPGGKGGIGTANICYRFGKDENPKDATWMDEAIDYALSYNRENASRNPDCSSDQTIAEILDAQIELSAGFQSNARIRKAIEEYAMEWAKRRLSEMGLNPRDKHKTESYDFVCSYIGFDLFVEVKGTQTDGTRIFLTPGEVRHAKENPNSALFIVSDVQVQNELNPMVSGGNERIEMPLDLSVGKLEPRGFTYSLPIAGSESRFATSGSFHCQPMPSQTERLRLDRRFNAIEMEQIKKGFVPEQMEDKWLVHFDPTTNTLFIHRSWTGYCFYKVNFERNKNEWTTSESWVNRDRRQNENTNTSHDRDVASWVINNLLLHKDEPFPAT